MKKNYQKPNIDTIIISYQRVIMASGEKETLPYYLDDPQNPGNALSRRNKNSIWNDEDEENDY